MTVDTTKYFVLSGVAYLVIGDAVIHWLHLMAAVIWVGSMIFMSLVMQPVLRQYLAAEYRLDVYREIGRRFSPLQWGAWTILALTGALKLWDLRATPALFSGPFGLILGVKLVMVALMVVLSMLHSSRWGPQLIEFGPSHPQYDVLASKMTFWGRVNLALLAAIIFCAVLLRFNPW